MFILPLMKDHPPVLSNHIIQWSIWRSLTVLNFNLLAYEYEILEMPLALFFCVFFLTNIRRVTSIQRCCLTRIGITIVNIKQSHGCLIFIIKISIPRKMVFILKQVPGCRWITTMYLSSNRKKNHNGKSNWRSHSLNIKMPSFKRVATGLAEKIPRLSPDCQHKFQSLSRYIHCGNFLQYIQNHIKITLFIHRCFNAVVLKKSQHKRMFSTSWKLSVSCAKHYAKHENKSSLEKHLLTNDIWMKT